MAKKAPIPPKKPGGSMMAMRSGFKGLVHRSRKPGQKPAPHNKFFTILLTMFAIGVLLYVVATN